MIEGIVNELGELKAFESLPTLKIYVAIYRYTNNLNYWYSMSNMDKNELIKALQFSTHSNFCDVRIYSIPV